MRNLCRVLSRLNCGIKNFLVQLKFNNGSRGCSTLETVSTRRKSKKKSLRLSTEVTKAINEIRLNKSKNCINGKTLYLVDEKVAQEFSSLIISNRKTKSDYVAEINAGLGFLSKALLQAGISSLNMYECVPYLHQNLTSLVNKYEGHATLRPIDFQQLWSVGYVDWKENVNKLNTYVDIEKRPWHKDPAIEVIGAFGDSNFIRRLISTIIFQTTLAKFGRMVLYVAVPPSIWLTMTCNNDHYYLYRRHSILFQVLFNGEIIGTLPRSAFYPHYRNATRKLKKKKLPTCLIQISKHDAQLMYVVKIEPKADLFKNNFTESDLVPFYYFIHHHLKSRRSKVIPSLEKWVPGCGRYLIAKDYNIFTEFGELTPKQLLDLFNLFKSWPEFADSSFVSCMDTFLMRMDEHIIFDNNSENLEEMLQVSLDEVQTSLN